MSKLPFRLARAVVFTSRVVTALPTLALEIELTDRSPTELALRVHSGKTPADVAIAQKFASQGYRSDDAGAGSYLLTLDSTPRISHYLRAARLSGGIYVYLPGLCPDGECTGIQFTVKARHILFGDAEATDALVIGPADAASAAVFFTNETHPRLGSGLYVGPEFSASAAEQIRASAMRIRVSYAGIAHRDVLAGVGAIATTVRNNGGYTGFGGDSLNIIRMTFDNPDAVAESGMVATFISVYAHEAAHKLQSPRLFDLPQGKLVAEGSADFLKVVILGRSGLRGERTTTEFASTAFDECLRHRAAQGLLERIASHEVDYREYYDCGMVDYFGLMFSQQSTEDEFLAQLLAVLAGQRERTAISADCLTLGPSCADAAVIDMMGDAEHLRARRAWFIKRLNEFTSRGDR